MKVTLTLSEEQINQLIHYSQTKSITTACNFVQSLVAQIEKNIMEGK